MPDAKQFQPLSVTPVQFSLTDGTAIPAPPDSPKATSRPPTPGRGPQDPHTSTAVPNGNGPTTLPADTPKPTATAQAAHAQSPPQTRRMSSVRKLLSLRKNNTSRADLHQSNGGGGLANKPSSDSIHSSRPGSPLASPTSPHSLARKKSAGWFHSGRRRSGMSGGRGSDGFGMEADAAAADDAHKGQPLVPRGPPPPTIPEFREFRSLDGELDSSLGGMELFKDIK